MWDLPIFQPKGGPDLKRIWYTEEHVISTLKQNESGASPPNIAHRRGVAENTVFRLKPKFGGMEDSEANRLRELKAKNAKLNRPLGEAELKTRPRSRN